MTPSIIQARELSRWYGIVMGLNNVSFDIEPGLVGLVGPNGAGKSTLIQIATGQLRPSSGSLTVFGETPWNNPRLLRRIGYCPERESIPKDLRPLEWLTGLGRMSGFHPRILRDRCVEMLDRVKLPREHWKKRLGQYSKGMRQRVKLAQAMLHDPDLLILDEPMNGLDPMGRQEISTILRELVAQGKSVVISSHILPEMEALCQSIIILSWGRILASGSQKAIRADLKNWPEQLRLRCTEPEKLARALFDTGMIRGFLIDPEDGALNVHVKDAAPFFDRLAGLLIDTGVTVHEIRSESRSLKSIFEKVTT